MITNAFTILYKLRSCAQPLLCAIAIIAVSVALFAAPALAQSAETLVSNTGVTDPADHHSSSNQAQAFTTGSHVTGYELASVGIELANAVGSPSLTVRITPNSATNRPDESDSAKIITLTNPATLTANSVNVFTAPPGTTLEPDTTYHVVATVADGTPVSSLTFQQTTNKAEDIGSAAGWSIADQSRWKTLIAGSWTTSTAVVLRMEVNGILRDTNDASLSALDVGSLSSVEKDDEYFPLTPAFDPETTNYTLTVDNAVTYLALRPTSTEVVTSVEYLDADDATIEDICFDPTDHVCPGLDVKLDVGSQTIKVKVTAADGETTQTYTITVTRRASTASAPTGCHSTDIWCTSLVLENVVGGPTGYLGSLQRRTHYDFGELLKDSFDLEGTTFFVDQLTFGHNFGNKLHFRPDWWHFFPKPFGTQAQLPASLVPHLVLQIGSQQFTFADAVKGSPGQEFYWQLTTATAPWTRVQAAAGNTVTVRLWTNTARGFPEISGRPQIGKPLTASRGTIVDRNGLPTNFPGDYAIQWVRVDGSSETDIAGATSRTYTPTDADEGKRIRVKISFTDNAGNAKGPLLSAPTDEVLDTCAAEHPDATWCTTMTVGSRSGISGFNRIVGSAAVQGYGEIEDRTVNFGCSTYVVEAIITDGFGLNLETHIALPRESRFFVDGSWFTVNRPAESNDARTGWFDSSGFSWSDSDELIVALYFPSSPGPCKPAIVGMSNLAEPRDAAREVSPLFHISQAFTTGPAEGGYSFQGVGLVSTWDGPPSYMAGLRVGIRDVWFDGRPGIGRYRLENPASMKRGRVSLFRAPVGAFLEPNSTYMVVIEPVYLESGGYLGPEMEPQVINHSFMFTESKQAFARADWSFGAQHQRGDSVTVEWNGFDPWEESTLFNSWYRPLNIGRNLLMSVYAEPFQPDLDPWPTVQDDSASEAFDTELEFAVVLSHAPTQTVRFKYATSDGTAKAGSDYVATSGTLTFEPGVPLKFIRVPINDDSVEDDGETLTLTLTDLYGSFIAAATGTITNQESIANPLTASFEALPDSHSGDSFTFTLNFSEDVSGLSAAKLRGHAFNVSNGRITAAQQLDPDGDEPSKTWQITVEPHADGPVTVSLPETTDCNASGGICVDEKPLSATVSATVEGPAVWSATMTAAPVYQDYGYIDLQGNQRGSLTSKSFEIEGETYAVNLSEAWDRIYIGFDKQIPVDFTLSVDGTELASTDATHASYSYAEVYTWSGQDIYWDDGDEVKLALYVESDDPEPTNSPATGAPAISGTATVGQTLTADTSGIADADGLTNVAYTYQWVRADADISGATSWTYTLVDDDQSKTIKVTASFTDDAGNGESLTSTATASVAARPNRAATGAPTISGTAQVGQTLTADTSGIADADGLTNVSWAYQWIANNGTSDTEIKDATGSTLFVLAAYEDQTIKVQVSFTDDAGHSESLTSAATEAVTLAAQAQQSNSEATGAPTISGTAQVGQTLTANTSGISDDDGLTEASYTYQWVRNDGVDDSDISGANSSTYELVDADRGKTINVKVSFTDDEGNDESLTSAATAAVAARPNRAATGAPTISGTAQVGQTLTANTSGISDEDGLDDVSYSYQWLRDDAEISGATSLTYTLTDDDQGKTIKIEVSFTDDEGNDESLTSAATASVAAPPLTAEFLLVPASHDGETVFSFRISFTEDLQNQSGRRIIAALSVSGGTVKSANRVNKARDLFVVKVTPSGTGDIAISLDAFTGSCEDDDAICARDGRKLANRSGAIISGPGP